LSVDAARVPAPRSSEEPPTERTRVRRLAERGRYDREVVCRILDEGLVAHVGFVDEKGPCVIPTAYGREGDWLYLHGAAGNAALRTLRSGGEACVTVTLLDGIVLARSAFHHSINYRSVVIFGRAEEVVETSEKLRALMTIVEHVVQGRGRDAREPTESELRSTRVVRLPIDEASAKIRTGGSVTDPEDLELQVWSGQIPLAVKSGTPVPDEVSSRGIPVPAYADPYTRPGW